MEAKQRDVGAENVSEVKEEDQTSSVVEGSEAEGSLSAAETGVSGMEEGDFEQGKGDQAGEEGDGSETSERGPGEDGDDEEDVYEEIDNDEGDGEEGDEFQQTEDGKSPPKIQDIVNKAIDTKLTGFQEQMEKMMAVLQTVSHGPTPDEKAESEGDIFEVVEEERDDEEEVDHIDEEEMRMAFSQQEEEAKVDEESKPAETTSKSDAEKKLSKDEYKALNEKQTAEREKLLRKVCSKLDMEPVVEVQERQRQNKNQSSTEIKYTVMPVNSIIKDAWSKPLPVSAGNKQIKPDIIRRYRWPQEDMEKYGRSMKIEPEVERLVRQVTGKKKGSALPDDVFKLFTTTKTADSYVRFQQKIVSYASFFLEAIEKNIKGDKKTVSETDKETDNEVDKEEGKQEDKEEDKKEDKEEDKEENKEENKEEDKGEDEGAESEDLEEIFTNLKQCLVDLCDVSVLINSLLVKNQRRIYMNSMKVGPHEVKNEMLNLPISTKMLFGDSLTKIFGKHGYDPVKANEGGQRRADGRQGGNVGGGRNAGGSGGAGGGGARRRGGQNVARSRKGGEGRVGGGNRPSGRPGPPPGRMGPSPGRMGASPGRGPNRGGGGMFGGRRDDRDRNMGRKNEGQDRQQGRGGRKRPSGGNKNNSSKRRKGSDSQPISGSWQPSGSFGGGYDMPLSRDLYPIGPGGMEPPSKMGYSRLLEEKARLAATKEHGGPFAGGSRSSMYPPSSFGGGYYRLGDDSSYRGFTSFSDSDGPLLPKGPSGNFGPSKPFSSYSPYGNDDFSQF